MSCPIFIAYVLYDNGLKTYSLFLQVYYQCAPFFSLHSEDSIKIQNIFNSELSEITIMNLSLLFINNNSPEFWMMQVP